MRYLITIQEFSSLSAILNFQLSGTPINWSGILSIICKARLSPWAEEYLINTLKYLWDAYHQQKRKLGPFAVLHPIRTAALLAKAHGTPIILDLLTTLLHDKDEDITADKYCKEDWEKLERSYQELIDGIDSNENWFLNERIYFLSRQPDEKYHEYLIKLISQSRNTPELLKVKLADRLDNTLDLRMDLYEDTSSTDCCQLIFEALFVDTYRGPVKNHHNHMERKINGASRLYELFKNAVFLSMLRSENIELDKPARKLFETLAVASINEAQNIMLHIFNYHMRDTEKHKELLLDVMNYRNDGGLLRVTANGKHKLDGLFLHTFDYKDKGELKKKLNALYSDKELMVEAAVAFAAIFSSFLNDNTFKIEGITADGIQPMSG